MILGSKKFWTSISQELPSPVFPYQLSRLTLSIQSKIMMKTALLAVLSLLLGTAAPAHAAEATAAGRWAGAIEVLGQQLDIVVRLADATGGGMSATIDIPAQGAKDLPLTNVRREGSRIHFELPAGPGLAVFEGTLEGDRISGEFSQAGITGRFTLERKPEEAAAPAAPPPYSEEEVTFTSGDVRLAGTLTLPPGPGRHPAVVLLTGSGAQNRDEEIFGFRPFRILADHLTRQGIAVLRFDDRGVGGSSGSLAQATLETLAGDALAAVSFLRTHGRIQPTAVGLLGHSEGGLVAAISATRSPDIAFLVFLASPGVRGDRVVSSQVEAMQKLAGRSQEEIARTLALQEKFYRAVRTGQGWEDVESDLLAEIAKLPEEQRKAVGDPKAYVAAQKAAADSSLYRNFLDFDPATVLRQVRLPVLSIFGELDLQVLPDLNREAMMRALQEAGNRNVTVRTFPGANHLFQKAITGSPGEYPVLAKEFVPGLPDFIAEWILKQRPAAARAREDTP